MVRTLIHIGMPRAASTLFQQEVFPLISGFRFEGVQRCHYNSDFQQMMYQDASLFDAEAFAEATKDLRQSNTIMSNELLVGQTLYLNATNRSRNMARLAAAFPEGEIILFLRNQCALLQSLYSIGVYAGHTESPEDFVQFDPRYDTFAPTEHVDNYRYTPLLQCLRTHFTKVHPFLFEDFQKNPDAFVKAFAQRLEVSLTAAPAVHAKVNQSFTQEKIRIMRKLNRLRPLMERSASGRALFRSQLRKLERRAESGKPFKFEEALAAKIRNHVRDDNRQLLELVPEWGDNPAFATSYLQ